MRSAMRGSDVAIDRAEAEAVLREADQDHAASSAARAKELAAVARIDETNAWRGRGSPTLASFLAARWPISLATARELVRDAKALSARPGLAHALANADISVDQAKALCVLCREGTDDEEVWLESLWSWSFPELEREARKETARKLERKDDGVYFRASHTPDERYLRGQFQLHPEEGAVVMAAIDAHMPKGTDLREWDKASAEALVELAKRSGAGRSDPPTVLLSVSEESLRKQAGSDQVAALGAGGAGGFVGAETARRLVCDSRLQALVKDESGKLLETSHTSRTIPAYLRRAVLDRDGGVCTFPGCGREHYLEVHHVIHVADDGPTEVWNLLTTCWTHHKLVHEGGWSVRGEAGPKITWIKPDGSPFEPRVRVVLDTC